MKIVAFYELAPDGLSDFIKGDPFVTSGIVARWRLVDWNAAFL